MSETIAIKAETKPVRDYLEQIVCFAGFKIFEPTHSVLEENTQTLLPDFVLEFLSDPPFSSHKNQGFPASLPKVRLRRQERNNKEAGLDVCFSLPLRGGELAHALASEARFWKEKNPYCMGRYKFFPSESLLVTEKTGEEIRLTEKETSLLKYLAERGGESVSRQDLLDIVWAYADGVETHTLETHIYRLRQKMEDDPSVPQVLLTTESGYCLKTEN